jgi:beta-lactamase class A
MKRRSSISVLQWLSLSLLFFSAVLMILQLIRFSQLWANYPFNMKIGGIPVGQLDRQQAAQRLLEIYTLPVELVYNEQAIHLSPSAIGLELDLEGMLAAAEQERTRTPFWTAFWDYLWERRTIPVDIPLVLSYPENRLRVFLTQEIASRYDSPPTAAIPVAGTAEFTPGLPGTSLDVDRAIPLIDSALRSTTQRKVILPVERSGPPPPTFKNLEILLRQIILDSYEFDGAIGLFLMDLQNGQDISLVYNQGEAVSIPPETAFTASSTIKIPIMVSAFKNIGSGPDEKALTNQTIQQLEAMIGQSNNPSSDWIMENIIDRNAGPLRVSDDMKALGLENTFLAGYFYQGAPLLFRYRTPANQRTDFDTEPDIYSQTTPAEIGMLLFDVYQCAENDGGTLKVVFPGKITQSECQTMIQYLKNDRTPWLIPAGLPDGTEVAHKHGWVTDAYGIIHDMSDAAIVFTNGGNYVLAIFLYHPVQLVFEPSNAFVTDLSRAVYNFYNNR